MIRNLLLGLSGTAVGAAAFISYERLRMAIRTDRWQLFYALASGGFAGAIFLVAKAVFRHPRLPITGDTYWYAICLSAASVGYIGIAVDQRRRNRRREDTQEEP